MKRRTWSGDRRRLMVGGTAFALVASLGAGLWATRALTTSPDAPSGLSAKALSPTEVVLDWKGADDADSYVVRVGADRALTGDKTKAIKATGKTTLTISDMTPSTPGVDQFYRVDAVYDGKTVSSRTARFSLLPGAVGKISIPKRATTGAQATWPAVANARQYDVVMARDKSFSKETTAVRTLAAAAEFVTNSLAPKTSYWIKVRAVNGNHVGAFSKPVSFTTYPEQSAFRVAAWNICSEACGGYRSRGPIQAAFLNDNKIDLFGLQEAGGVRIGAVTNAIFSGGKQKFVRATGGRNTRYIFYRPALFTQLGGNTFGIGNGKYTTWAAFRINATGQEFIFVNIHLTSGKSSVDGKRASEMRATIAGMANVNKAGLPMIYAGDFNAGFHRAFTPGVMLRDLGFSDSVSVSKTKPVNAHINSGHTFSTAPRFSGDFVDHIFVSKQFQVMEWKQLVRMNGNRYATPVVSDHNAISALVALGVNAKSLGEDTPTTTVAGLTQSLP